MLRLNSSCQACVLCYGNEKAPAPGEHWGLMTVSACLKGTLMLPPRKVQEILIEDGMAISVPENINLVARKKRKDAPQLFCKLLNEGVERTIRCYKKYPHVSALFVLLVSKMNEHNIVHLSINEIAQSLEIEYQVASRCMSVLCNNDMVSRTGQRSVWMINPHVATKCNEAEGFDLQMDWHDLCDSIAKKKQQNS